MKKCILILALLLMTALFASCIELPDEPHEYLPWCKELYQEHLTAEPDYPPAFVGACVSTLQTGQPNAFVSLCGYEPFRDSMEIGEITKKECIQYIHSLEVES